MTSLLGSLVRRFYSEMWNECNVSVIPEITAPELTFRGSLGDVHVGHAGLASYVAMVTTALADYRCDLHTLVVEGDEAAARLTFSGRHVAPFLGVPATDRDIQWAGAAFFVLRDALISDIWVLGDVASIRTQLS